MVKAETWKLMVIYNVMYSDQKLTSKGNFLWKQETSNPNICKKWMVIVTSTLAKKFQKVIYQLFAFSAFIKLQLSKIYLLKHFQFP